MIEWVIRLGAGCEKCRLVPMQGGGGGTAMGGHTGHLARSSEAKETVCRLVPSTVLVATVTRETPVQVKCSAVIAIVQDNSGTVPPVPVVCQTKTTRPGQVTVGSFRLGSGRRTAQEES